MRRRLLRLAAALALAGALGAVAVEGLRRWKAPAQVRAMDTLTAYRAGHPKPWDDATKAGFAARCLAVADQHPGTASGDWALGQAVALCESAEARRRVAEIVATGPLRRVLWVTTSVEFVPTVLARTVEAPGDPDAPALLLRVCSLTRPGRAEFDHAKFDRAATLLTERDPSGRESLELVIMLGGGAGTINPTLVAPYEAQLRTLVRTTDEEGAVCAAKLGIPWRSLRYDPAEPAAKAWFTRALPTLAVVGADGVVRRRWHDPIPPGELEATVEAAVGEAERSRRAEGRQLPDTGLVGAGRPPG